MKAKEYAEKFFNSEDKKLTLGQIFCNFVAEISTIAEMRNSYSESSIKAILREQDQKWKSFCRIINSKSNVELKEDGFSELLKKREPALTDLIDSMYE